MSPWAALGSAVSNAAFLQLCRHHGVQSLLFHCAKDHQEWRSWPEMVRQELEQASKAAIAEDLLRRHHLAALTTRLDERGLRYLLTKGEALAQTHYPTPGTRTRCDSDIFIPLADIGRVRQIAEDAGFTVVGPIYKSHQFTVCPRGNAQGPVEIDVHWRVLNAARFARVISFEEAYARSVQLPAGAVARTLSPADSLLLACLHRAGSDRHDRNRLIWLHDIHLLVATMNPASLEEFSRDAVRRSVQAVCREGLALSARCFGSDISPATLLVLASPEPRDTIFRRIVLSQLALLIDDWKQLGSFAARRALLGELFMPPAGELEHRYGRRGRMWAPMLAIRQVLGGLARRLSLK